MFSAYLRPGEALDLRLQDLVSPIPGSPHFALHLHPAERREQSKVGLSDESLLLDSPMMPWLGPVLAALPRKGSHAGCDLRQLGRMLEEPTLSSTAPTNSCSAVSTEALRSIPRSVHPSSKSGRGEAEGSLGSGLFSSKIRSTCSHQPRVFESGSKIAKDVSCRPKRSFDCRAQSFLA